MGKTIWRSAAAILAALVTLSLPAQAQTNAGPGKVEVQWLGQSAFRIVSPGGKVIVIDPWLTTDPATPAKYKDLAALGKVDVLLVTHGHFDHIADAPEIARRNAIPMYAPGDLNMSLTTLEVLPAAQLPRFNKGGTVEPVPGIKVTAVRAEHSSVFVWKNPATEKNETHAGGEPIGYIVEFENGFRLWHMGDTGLFGDMKFIAEHYRPSLVLLPIGGNFTMDPADAAFALREWIKPKFAMPMHYGTNPLAKGTPAQFLDALGKIDTKVLVPQPGEVTAF
jgi:L-ascorbate metabolism protein UlaG (beta-lactamase superfamily)